MREVSDLFLRYQKYDNWQLYEGVVQTLFKGGPKELLDEVPGGWVTF